MTAPGPAELGRGVVINVGDTPPAPWRDAPVVVIDDSTLSAPAAAVGVLHAAWSERSPVVVALGVDPARFRTPPQRRAEPWTLDAGLRLWDEELQFLVWANAYDGRGGGEPVWWWGRKAAKLGARPAAAGDPGDAVTGVLGPVWVDGGPREPFPHLQGLPVVHRESVERGRLVATSPPSTTAAADLAADQRRAVAHRRGSARIIAPAGSGKTRVLTERLRHLVVGCGWERDTVLAVAYNKKAQEELDARCGDFRPRTRTLNSLGLWVLGQARGRAPAVLAEREVRRLVDRLAPPRRHRANTDPVGPYLEALSRVRLALVDPEEVEAERDDVPGLPAVFAGLRADFAATGDVDFDEQIYGAVEALMADGALRGRLQATCRHLLVDEFQDLTPAHVLLLRLLAGPGGDVFGVGDDDQVIYGHAGADPGFLIGYGDLFPGAGDHPLEVNYRCPPAVTRAAATLLSYNHRRVEKTIVAGRPDPGGGGPGEGLDVVCHPQGRGAATAAARAQAWIDGGARPADIAVLARVHSALLAPALALRSAGVAVTSTLSADILERTGLRAALAYLRIATAADGCIDAADLVEVLRRPSRGLPPWFADRIRRRVEWHTGALGALAGTVADKDAAKVERFAADVEALRAAATAHATAGGLLAVVRDEIGLGGAMGLLDASRGGEGSSHLDDLDALAEVAALHPDAATLEGWVRRQLSQPPDPSGVTLSTVHRVKGMEWNRVVVYGCSAGLWPHRLAGDDEEERRILHVAVTRAREAAVVLGERDRPSPLLAELAGAAPHSPPATANPPSSPPAAGRRAPTARDAPAALGGRAAVAETALRAWRTGRARKDKVPAFIVLSDRTLRAIATARPDGLVALRQVDGIGPAKLELYGAEILAVLAGDPGGDPAGATARRPAGEAGDDPAGDPARRPAGDPGDDPAGATARRPAGDPVASP